MNTLLLNTGRAKYHASRTAHKNRREQWKYLDICLYEFDLYVLKYAVSKILLLWTKSGQSNAM
jgi:hypothetical protein